MTHALKLTSATAALALGLGSAALAQDTASEGDMSMNGDGAQMAGYESGRMSDANMENLIRVSEITDGVVYTVEVGDDEWMSWDTYEGAEAELDQIGNIADVAISPDGRMTGIIVETGGFLDIGDSHVLVNLGDIKLMDSGDANSYSYVTRLSEEELQNLPDVGENWF
ncbi:PRC-barrel domain-containing protein [Histidinibacterium lentulum]|nr:PRC-barrel domain-containing protein [Histidinibacterium lentulum]